MIELDRVRLRGLRLRRGFTMQELGRKAGINPITVGRLESGRQRAQLVTVRKLAEALGVEPWELLIRRTPEE